MDDPAPPPTAPQETGGLNEEERNLAMLCHLLGILTGFVGPLILWLVYREKSAFVAAHGKESLNFQLTFLIVTIAVAPVAVVLGFLSFGILLFPFAGLWLAIVIFALIWAIRGCVAASTGEPYRYPANFRLIA